jgi:hypothetical protein
MIIAFFRYECKAVIDDHQEHLNVCIKERSCASMTHATMPRLVTNGLARYKGLISLQCEMSLDVNFHCSTNGCYMIDCSQM